MKIKYLIIAVLLLFSCKKYEKKVLKVTMSFDRPYKMAWDGGAYGVCETNGLKEYYYKEGTALNFQIYICNANTTNIHAVIKCGTNVLYDGNGTLQKINVVVKRK